MGIFVGLCLFILLVYIVIKVVDTLLVIAKQDGDKNLTPNSKVIHPCIESAHDLIDELSLYDDEYILVDGQTYHFVNISCKWKQDYIQICYKGRTLGFKEYSRDEFTELNNKISSYKKPPLKNIKAVKTQTVNPSQVVIKKDSQLIPRTAKHLVLNKIPPYRKQLLYISYDEPKGHAFGLQVTIAISEQGNVDLNKEVADDPSTIYSTLPVVEPNNKNIQKLGYFPSYSEMLPEQRGLYLYWLYDVTKTIDVGYVFVYYYGLERQLVYGDFDAAFDEIILLRKHHDNSSIQSYSASALVHSCLLKNRVDKLQRLYEVNGFDYFGNSNLLMLHYAKSDITPEMIFKLATRLPDINRRYIKLHPELYKLKILDILNEKFGKPIYPSLAKFLLKNVTNAAYPIFANISFDSDVRTPPLPNLLGHPPFVNEISSLLKKVHEAVKGELKRKRKKTVKSRIA